MITNLSTYKYFLGTLYCENLLKDFCSYISPYFLFSNQTKEIHI